MNEPENRKEEISEGAEIRIKYKGYIERERMIADKMHRLEDIKIKGHFDYSQLKEISTEGRQKLKHINPDTLGPVSYTHLPRLPRFCSPHGSVRHSSRCGATRHKR